MKVLTCGQLDVFYIRCYQVKNLFIQISILKSIIDLIDLIENCDYNFKDAVWELISDDAKDLI